MVSTSYEPALSPRAYRGGPTTMPQGQEHNASEGAAARQLPELDFGDMPVNAKMYQHSGTGFFVGLGWVFLVGGVLAATVATFGAALFGLLTAPIADYFRHKKLRALVRGSGVEVGPDQLSEIHRCVESFSRRLGLRKAPEVFLVEDSTQNGVAFKLGKGNAILLTDDIVWGALKSGDVRTLGFVLGHEVAHIALGHTGTIRTLMKTFFRPLARCDEYTADNVAAALVDDKNLAARGIALLAIGPQLMPFVNPQALARQAREVWRDKHAKKAERSRSHPLLLRRIGNLIRER